VYGKGEYTCFLKQHTTDLVSTLSLHNEEEFISNMYAEQNTTFSDSTSILINKSSKFEYFHFYDSGVQNILEVPRVIPVVLEKCPRYCDCLING
jgi:hypothetical protein